jgi:hypothetical protein
MRELSMHVLDLLENALEAGATQVQLTIEEDLAADKLMIEVEDNGRGMDRAVAERALDPFYTTRTTRHVGLGLPLLKAAAERCGGSLTLTSGVGSGTVVRATFVHSHLDRAPLGRVEDSLLAFLMSEKRVGLVYRHRVGEQVFEMDTAAIEAELDGVPLSHPRVRQWLHVAIREGERELYLGSQVDLT